MTRQERRERDARNTSYQQMLDQVAARRLVQQRKKQLPPCRDPCKGMAEGPVVTPEELSFSQFLAGMISEHWMILNRGRLCHVQGQLYCHKK